MGLWQKRLHKFEATQGYKMNSGPTWGYIGSSRPVWNIYKKILSQQKKERTEERERDHRKRKARTKGRVKELEKKGKRKRGETKIGIIL